MKKILLLSSIVIICIALLVQLFSRGADVENQEDVTQFPDTGSLIQRPAVSSGERMILSADGFIEISDITINPIVTYDGGVTLFSENKDFSMLYYSSSDQFLISLMRADDFTAARAYAEESFLDTLGITQKEACSLSVDLVVPPYIDFDLADSYGLSFCTGAKIIPQGFILE